MSRRPNAVRHPNLATIIINAVLLYLINAHPGWQSVSFLTPATEQVIGLVNLALAVGIAVNVLYFAVKPRRLRAIGDLIMLIIGLITALRIWQVFPFAFHGSAAYWSTIIRALLVIGIAGTCLAILASLVALARGARPAGQ